MILIHNQDFFYGMQALGCKVADWLRRWRILEDLYQWGNAMDGSMSSSMELIPIRGKTLHE